MDFLKKLIPQKLKNVYHLGQAISANFWYGFPAKKLKVIGVTGTNGKTTTCQMIAKILEEAGFKTAMISTINFKLGEKEWVNKTKFTTLSSFFLQKFARDAAANGCQYLILEISSHALDQNRVWGIDFDTAVITNVTREHLDYHKTMEEYREAKLRLFEKARVAVVNLDMEKPEEFLKFNNKYVYTFHPELVSESKDLLDSGSVAGMTLIKAENLELGITYSKFAINGQKFTVNMPGLFNVENALAAACVGLAYNVDLQTISRALEKIKGIPGRMEYVPNNKGINIIVDFALTPDSLEKLYGLIKNIRSHSSSLAQNSRVISVFGSCGRRDKGKRPLMGEVVSKYADYVIITNEDPYDENPQQIIDEVFSGVVTPSPTSPPYQGGEEKRGLKIESKNAFRILDRREAIKKALQIAKPGDFVVITGKGHEETMSVGNKRIPWNDKKVILELLQELK